MYRESLKGRYMHCNLEIGGCSLGKAKFGNLLNNTRYKSEIYWNSLLHFQENSYFVLGTKTWTKTILQTFLYIFKFIVCEKPTKYFDKTATKIKTSIEKPQQSLPGHKVTYAEGDVIQYQCKEDYVITEGVNKTTCQDDGSWSPNINLTCTGRGRRCVWWNICRHL